jgi:serine/threonine protein kinase
MQLKPGQTFAGLFEIIEGIAHGAFGTIYKVRHIGLDKIVALKILMPSDETSLARFHREAQILAKIVHENVSQVFSFGVAERRPYMAMEFIEATDLRKILAQRKLHWRESAEIVIQICSGLHAVHEEGVIHRDLKPENLLLTAAGQIKIIDFGLSSLRLPQALNITQDGTTLGTPAYMSPEQWFSAEVDRRSDIYAAGCILFECLSGSPPMAQVMASATADDLGKQCQEIEIDFDAVAPAFQPIIRKALQKQPDRRYQSAQDFADDLRALLRRPVDDRTSSPAARISPSRLRPLWVSATVGIVIVFFAIWCGQSLFCSNHLDPSEAQCSLRSIAQLYEQDIASRHAQAEEQLKRLIEREERSFNPDPHILYEAYTLAAGRSQTLETETYLEKAVNVARKRGGNDLLESLWLLSQWQMHHGKSPAVPLAELYALAKAESSNTFEARASCSLAREAFSAGNLKDAENYALYACRWLNKEQDIYPFADSLLVLMSLDTAIATDAAERYLLKLSPRQAEVLYKAMSVIAIPHRQSVGGFLRCLRVVARVREQAVVDAYRCVFITKGSQIIKQDPSSTEPICFSLMEVFPGDDSMHFVIGCAVDLQEKQPLVSERLLNLCHQRCSKSRAWPLAYQGYLDRFFSNNKTNPDKIAKLLPDYTENMHQLGTVYGIDSTEYALALWQRADMYRVLKNWRASLKDYDACGTIVSKKKGWLLTMDSVRGKKAEVKDCMVR